MESSASMVTAASGAPTNTAVKMSQNNSISTSKASKAYSHHDSNSIYLTMLRAGQQRRIANKIAPFEPPIQTTTSYPKAESGPAASHPARKHNDPKSPKTSNLTQKSSVKASQSHTKKFLSGVHKDPDNITKKIRRLKFRISYNKKIFNKLSKYYAKIQEKEIDREILQLKKTKKLQNHPNKIDIISKNKNTHLALLNESNSTKLSNINTIKYSSEVDELQKEALVAKNSRVITELESSAKELTASPAWNQFALLSQMLHRAPKLEPLDLPAFSYSMLDESAVSADRLEFQPFSAPPPPAEQLDESLAKLAPGETNGNHDGSGSSNKENKCLESSTAADDLEGSFIISKNINGTVFCKGDDVNVLKQGIIEFRGKILLISAAKFLIKGESSRMKIDTCDLTKGTYVLELINPV